MEYHGWLAREGRAWALEEARDREARFREPTLEEIREEAERRRKEEEERCRS